MMNALLHKVLLISLLIVAFESGVTSFPILTAQKSFGSDVVTTTRCGSSKTEINGEVVGAAGRMGSFWLKQTNAVAVPRGVAPGSFSSLGNPIFVATPSRSWAQVYQETLKDRRRDLVFVGNGLPTVEFQNATVVVPHYGILEVGQDPVSSPESPPSLVYGRHAAAVIDVFNRHGLLSQLVGSWQDLVLGAARKLLWASCMWLLCHLEQEPITASQVHKERHVLLQNLVEELSPALQLLTGKRVDRNETMNYLQEYSNSIADAIPSKVLAIDEVKERNGVWLGLRDKVPQPLHQELLEKVGGPSVLQEALSSNEQEPGERIESRLVEANLTVWGSRRTTRPPPGNHALVIGGGILGSTTAFYLARQGYNVTVCDRLDSSKNVGLTTPASWAWINANGKSPRSYQWLNQLGMRAWRQHGLLKSLPTWNGALVSYSKPPTFYGDYAVEGPLSKERLHELEPNAIFSENGTVFHFPDDGCVDPSLAVKAIRRASSELGVEFLTGEQATELIRDENGCVNGVVLQNLETNKTHSIEVSVVIVAAGIGSAANALAGIPLLDRPGKIALATPNSSILALDKILVDTCRKSHVLQRRDGMLVVGGGDLEIGGSTTARRSMLAAGDSLLQEACQLAPSLVKGSTLSHTAHAVRPIPKDGLPAVGYLEPNLYVVVSHSGVTLAPILGSLAAIEIREHVAFDLLEPFRPTRFFSEALRRKEH